MKILAFTALIFSVVLVDAQASLAELDSANYFDFWEGTWQGTWSEGLDVGEATNLIEWTTGGKVLRENFVVTKGQNAGFVGTSISVYNPNTRVWHQAWADNQGSYFDFVGEFDENKRVFSTKPQQVNGLIVVSRMVFHTITEDTFTWDWERSIDGGETWRLSWQINYTRID